MDEGLSKSTNSPALVQVWGKGYRLTADSEEFQRYVPLKLPPGQSLEISLQSTPWGTILDQLYALSVRELSAQPCLLFSPSELMALSFAKTEDRHRRPSLLLTTATVNISWHQEDLAEIASRAVSLSSRLASAYSLTLSGNPPIPENQLRDSSFLPSRSFDLCNETPDKGVEWHHVISAVQKWRGVTGVASSKLLALGANIILGTKHEAERAYQQFKVDGYFDVRDKEIHPLSSNISPWEDKSVHSAPAPPKETTPINDLAVVKESILRVENRVIHLTDLFDKLIEILSSKEQKRKRF